MLSCTNGSARSQESKLEMTVYLVLLQDPLEDLLKLISPDTCLDFSDLVDLGWIPASHISNRLPGGTNAAGPKATLETQDSRKTQGISFTTCFCLSQTQAQCLGTE